MICLADDRPGEERRFGVIGRLAVLICALPIALARKSDDIHTSLPFQTRRIERFGVVSKLDPRTIPAVEHVAAEVIALQ